jgi:carbon-monoxide dehydrogenase medium subunit
MFIKRLPKFEYHAPRSVAEALDLLDRYGERAAVLAGGTDLLVAMKKRERISEHLINLKEIEALKGISLDEKEGIHIGALTPLGELERSSVVQEKLIPLWDAVNVMASPQVRSLATIGGNLCSAMPSADTAPPLIALRASIHILGIGSERKVLIENFFRGPGEPDLKPGEILTHILIPKQPEYSSGIYLKLMRRSAMDLAQLGVAVCLSSDAGRQICMGARIALGAAAQTPIRAHQAEEVLLNKEISQRAAKEAGRIASGEGNPRSSIRASKEYRKAMIGVLTERAILEAHRRIHS